jgi:hypothetical protein
MSLKTHATPTQYCAHNVTWKSTEAPLALDAEATVLVESGAEASLRLNSRVYSRTAERGRGMHIHLTAVVTI